MAIINRITGQGPTDGELEMLKERAQEIYANPYASPEQLEWAIEVHPEGFAMSFPTESYHKGRTQE